MPFIHCFKNLYCFFTQPLKLQRKYLNKYTTEQTILVRLPKWFLQNFRDGLHALRLKNSLANILMDLFLSNIF